MQSSDFNRLCDNTYSKKHSALHLKKNNRGAFAVVILSGIIIVIFAIYYSIWGQESRKKNSLELVIIICRQGDRSPLQWETYPNDLYPPLGEGIWPDGLGQLTSAGKIRSYEFGQRFKKRYSKFLPAAFNSSYILVQTTDTDRTSMTASTFLTGAFPPIGKQIWNKDIHWIPIPVHSISSEKDNLLRITKSCPKYDLEFEKAKNSTEIEMFKKHEVFLKYLSSHSGMEIKHLTDVENIYNSLNIQQRNHMTLPSWAKIINCMSKMEEIVLEWYKTHSKTEFMKKIRSGKLIGEIVRNMRDKMDGRLNPNRKMFAYFSHELTLIDFFNTLGMKNSFKPGYGAAAIVELHKIKKEYYVKLLYSKSYDSPDFLSLETESQTNFLPTLEEFNVATVNYVPENWDKDCQH
ncbi:prostatic acid phosphatase-like [Daktulosphaira vitifoliae]|uniref:prostatic acid phosphatase-like n=1 Tax=Daktulosphaira vitifoliae TaxID=58002 RepID=UPI0021AAEF79|nr:prostatic acid phosphatase-like [Daktulosphaira vitifoliae]